jgi:hypothetical protein
MTQDLHAEHRMRVGDWIMTPASRRIMRPQLELRDHFENHMGGIQDGFKSCN